MKRGGNSHEVEELKNRAHVYCAGGNIFHTSSLSLWNKRPLPRARNHRPPRENFEPVRSELQIMIPSFDFSHTPENR